MKLLTILLKKVLRAGYFLRKSYKSYFYLIKILPNVVDIKKGTHFLMECLFNQIY